MKFLLFFSFFPFLFLCAIDETIVEPQDYITDYQAKFELSKILARYPKDMDEGLEIFLELSEEKSQDSLLYLEIGRVYNKQKRFEQALVYLYSAIEKNPHSSDLLLEAARVELNLGHAKTSYDLYLQALEVSTSPDGICLEIANVYMLVGSFYQAEAIYREALCKKNTIEVQLALAWNLVSAGRYEEAEALYKVLLIQHPHKPEILEAMVGLHLILTEFCTALSIIDQLLEVYPDNPKYLLLQAEALYLNANFCESLQIYTKLQEEPLFFLKSQIGKGKNYLKLGLDEEAKVSFLLAYQENPESIPAKFYYAGEEAYHNHFIEQILIEAEKPEELLDWANVYAENGMAGILSFYEQALCIDPEYFPAKVGLAEAYSSHYMYKDALDNYLCLLEIFPHASKLMIEIARVLSWGKKYRNSMDWYDAVIEMNPQDPLPLREKARVAYWGKFFNESMALYEELLDPPLDALLYEELQNYEELSHEMLPFVDGNSLYLGYEKLLNANCLDFDEQCLLAKYFGLYRIQKAIYLEKTAKCWDWDNYSFHALPFYHELQAFSPGNIEGVYGYAQDFCNLGLCHCSRQLYEQMLHVTPSNSQVKLSLGRNLIRENDLIQGNYTFWTERGIGQFSNSQIARHQFDQIYEWSPSCNKHVRFMQNEWLEYPFLKHRYYPAEGQTIEYDHIYNGYVRGLASFTRKNYFKKFPSRYTGLATLWFNICDYAQLGFGFEKKNEIYNYFNLTQGTQAKIYWASLKANTHSWDILTTYRHLDYNDSNSLDHADYYIGYAFTEDPCIFKLILGGSYRNAAHLTMSIFDPDGQIVDVIHPYWTPRNYWSGNVTLEYRYNYAWFTFCEAPNRYIDLKITGEEDTVNNPSIQFAINWKHEFMRHFGIEITALTHLSKEWNASGVWAQAYYRF